MGGEATALVATIPAGGRGDGARRRREGEDAAAVEADGGVGDGEREKGPPRRDESTRVAARYRLQGASYVAAVEAATGEPVVRVVFAFLSEEGAIEEELPELRAAVDEVRASVAELAESAPVEPLAEL